MEEIKQAQTEPAVNNPFINIELPGLEKKKYH